VTELSLRRVRVIYRKTAIAQGTGAGKRDRSERSKAGILAGGANDRLERARWSLRAELQVNEARMLNWYRRMRTWARAAAGHVLES